MEDGRPRILVALADGDERAAAAAALAAAGFAAVEAPPGPAALAGCAARPPAALLPDAAPDPAAAIDALEGLRLDPATGALTVALAVAAGDAATMRAAYEAGANHILVRPLDPVALGHEFRFIIRASRLERDLRAARARAAAANEAKLNFLANMSHELRTPLHAIIGLAELIGRDGAAMAEVERARCAQMIGESGGRLMAVVDDLLTLAQLGDGKLALAEGAGDFAATARAALDRARPAAGRKGVALVDALPPGLPPLLADHAALGRALDALLSNAVKFTPKGGAVTLRAARAADGALSAAVADTGVGMSAKDVARVQKPFEQVETSLDRAHDGAGLGLPLAAGLIRGHGGRFAIQTALGRGTTASFTLPAARLQAAGASAAPDAA